MLKKLISLLVLTMYLHGMSGYTMSFHKCIVTGSEEVYTSFGMDDPCNEEEKTCNETATHFEEADCCDVQQTVVSVDDDSNISYLKTSIAPVTIQHTLVQSYQLSNTGSTQYFYTDISPIRPPEPCTICVFRI